jgi:curved DNA-binding protein CbpA
VTRTVLQWHPDRNRGREEEASKKFQTIQAAFEILTDPSSKRQYDDARNKTSSRFATASGVRGNPWSSAGSEWAPPPRRTNANPPPGSGGPQARPTPGASRYNNFTAHAAHRGKAQKDDPATAKSTYEAWNNMRAGAGRKPANTSNPPPPPPGRPPTSATRNPKASESEGMHRSASQRQKASASFGNSSRRTGFTPRSPGLGDEPPVSSNNYFTTRTHTNIFTDASASTAHQNHHASAAPDPLAQFRDNLTENRQRTPYSTPGGEKTSLFDDGPGLGRTKSTRQSTRNEGAEDTYPFPRQRPRSSSTPRSSSNDGGSEDSTRVNTGARSEGRRNSAKAGDRHRPKSSHSATQDPAYNGN